MDFIQPSSFLRFIQSIAIGSVLVISASTGLGEVYRVNHAAPGPAQDGLTWDTAYTTLEAALAVAVFGDEIWLATGTYTPAGPGGSRAATFLLNDGVSLYGGFSGTEMFAWERNSDPASNGTILSGDLNGDGNGFLTRSDNSYHVVTIATGAQSYSTRLFSVTVEQGFADGNGGHNSGAGLKMLGANAYIYRVIFRNNVTGSSGPGGGVYIAGGAPSFDDCRFINNSAYYGGGLCAFNTEPGTPQMFYATFTGNTASWAGGGIYLQNADANIQQSTFSGHFASIGGGMYVSASALTLVDVTVGNNILSGGATKGGAIYCNAATLDLDNCTFNNHTTGVQLGGAIYNTSGSTNILSNVTFQNNIASGSGGAVYSEANTTFRQRGGLYLNNGGLGTDYGGAIYSDSDPLEIVDVEFNGNGALFWGGSLWLGGNSLVANCSFTSASALRGAGLYVFSGDLTVMNSSFTSLRADGGGGGAMLFTGGTNSQFNLHNASIGGTSGGAIRLMSGNLAITNSVIWNNLSTNGVAGLPESSLEVIGGTAVIASSIVQGSGGSGGGWASQLGTDGGGNLDMAPLFLDDINFDAYPGPAWDLRLQVGSPAQNSGSNSALPPDVGDVDNDLNTAETLPLDLAGAPRIIGGTVNRGAFEGIYTTFALSHPGLDPNQDDNGNGVSNFDDYALGRDPSLPVTTSGPLEIWRAGDSAMIRQTIRGNGIDVSVSLWRSFDSRNWYPAPSYYLQLLETTWPDENRTLQQTTYTKNAKVGNEYFTLTVDTP